MTVENIPLQDSGASATVTSGPAVPMAQLDGDWLCDVCSNRDEGPCRLELSSKDTAYERRVCSGDPAHVKLIPVT